VSKKKSRKRSPNPVVTNLPSPSVPVPRPTVPEAPESLHHFFAREDWVAAAITSLISGFVFLYYMSPEVTLEDSGELVTGAFNVGVPHPPGYPLWAVLGWVWRHLVPFGNPAWRICLMSVLTGALVVGVLTLLMTHSIMMLLRSVTWVRELEDSMKHWLALTIGTASALLFGFNRGVWLWACVPEMRVLNVFMFIVTACTFFAWMMRPQRHGFLYATILLYALGISNHQTIVVMALPFMTAALALGLLTGSKRRPWQAAVAMPALSVFWELLVAALFSAAAGFLLWAWLETPPNQSLWSHSYALRALWALAVGAGIILFFGKQGWLSPRRALICTAMFLAGAAFYFYMPVASSTNPPMNWGYTYTKQGFLHHITRGQYERLNFASPLSEAFFIQIRLFTRALIQQYTTGLALFGLATLAVLIGAWKSLSDRARVADFRVDGIPDDELRAVDDHQPGPRQAEPGDQHQVLRARARFLCDDDRLRTGARRGLGVGAPARVPARGDAGRVRGGAGVAGDSLLSQPGHLRAAEPRLRLPVWLPHVLPRRRLPADGAQRRALRGH